MQSKTTSQILLVHTDLAELHHIIVAERIIIVLPYQFRHGIYYLMNVESTQTIVNLMMRSYASQHFHNITRIKMILMFKNIKMLFVGTIRYNRAIHWPAGIISILCWFCLAINELHTTTDALIIAIGLGIGAVCSFHFANYERSNLKWLGWLNFSAYSVFIMLIIFNNLMKG